MASLRFAVLAAALALAFTLIPATPSRAQGVEVVYSFVEGDLDGGWGPQELIADGQGRLYGATAFGGVGCGPYAARCGVVFELEPPAAPRWIHDLGYYGGIQTVRLSWLDGQLYGTESDVPPTLGRAFRLMPTATPPWEDTILRIFGPFLDDQQQTVEGGKRPMSPLLAATDGQLYGSTVGGGQYGFGTLYRLWPDGSGYEVLHSLTGEGGYQTVGTGSSPQGALVQGDDGHVYGTAWTGGTLAQTGPGVGTIFRFRGDTQEVERIHAFNPVTGGHSPEAGLTRGPDGRLFGTTPRGFSSPFEGGTGRLFEVLVGPEAGATATLVELHAFTAPGDGRFPKGELTWPSDGFLYGVTQGGGTYNLGTVFRIRPDGTDYGIVHSFGGEPDDGARPSSSLALGPGPALYGVTRYGGAEDEGVVYRIPLSRLLVVDLVERIEGLVDDGTLNGGQGHSLLTKLEQALDALQTGDTETATALLTDVVNQLNAFRNAGILDPDQADELIDLAEAAIASLSGQ